MQVIHQADTGLKKSLTCKLRYFRPSKKKFEGYLFHFPYGTQGTYKCWYAVVRFFFDNFIQKLTLRSRNSFDSILDEILLSTRNSCLDSPILIPVLFRLQLRLLLLLTDWFTSNVSVFNSVSLMHYFDRTLNVFGFSEVY